MDKLFEKEMEEGLNMNIVLKSDMINYELEAEHGIKLKKCNLKNKSFSWFDDKTESGDFSIQFDGILHSGNEDRFLFVENKVYKDEMSVITNKIVMRDSIKKLKIEIYYKTFKDLSIIEKWIDVTNEGDQNSIIERLDTINFNLPKEKYDLKYFTGLWGHEFTPVDEKLDGRNICIQGLMGRSSGNGIPSFMLKTESGQVMICCIAWSGNWVFRFEPLNIVSFGDHTYKIQGGIHDLNFFKEIACGQTFEGIHVITSIADGGDLDNASTHLVDWERKYWHMANNELSNSLPIEWNHWWPYEDNEINQEVFKTNVDQAAKIGLDVCTLDAGWFGPADKDASWADYRGDWDVVNSKRFPDGIKSLSDYAHEKGMKFGLWCEIEAVGSKASLNQEHPEYIAKRDGKHLGYVCFGNPETQKWAYETMDRLIRKFNCDWIKIDFNVDPAFGCNRADHGHQIGDGLYEHYKGYYKFLDKIQSKYPQVVFENCSSGGLRIDLEMMRHTHISFLSDPDMPEHNLQVAWGFTTVFPPEKGLHFTWSENKIENWIGFNPKTDLVEKYQLDFYIKTALLTGIGYSQKLPNLPDWMKDRFEYYNKLYKEKLRDKIKKANVYHLTNQPLRDGRGDRWVALEYLLSHKEEAIVFVYRLLFSEQKRNIKLKKLKPECYYRIRWEGKSCEDMLLMGCDLMAYGITFSNILEEESVILFINEVKNDVVEYDANNSNYKKVFN